MDGRVVRDGCCSQISIDEAKLMRLCSYITHQVSENFQQGNIWDTIEPPKKIGFRTRLHKYIYWKLIGCIQPIRYNIIFKLLKLYSTRIARVVHIAVSGLEILRAILIIFV